MPSKDREIRLATQRRSYARHREETIRKVAARKREQYAGVCRNCGGPTVGSTKKKIPEWCNKPECKSAQHKQDPDRFAMYGRLGKKHQQLVRGWMTPSHKRKRAVTIDEILTEMDKAKKERKEP